MSEEALLDWLCLHVDAADLPKRFVGESVSRKAAAGIKVMSKADEQRAAQRRCSSYSLLTSNVWHCNQGRAAALSCCVCWSAIMQMCSHAPVTCPLSQPLLISLTDTVEHLEPSPCPKGKAQFSAQTCCCMQRSS